MNIRICTTYYDPKRKKESSLDLSAKKLGVEVKNFGARSKFRTFAMTKLFPLRAFCEKSEDDIVIFLDGNDTILLDKPEQLVKTWEAKCGGKVAIGSEAVVWPYHHLDEQLKARHSKYGGGLMAYIDTGFIMGRPGDIALMLDVVLKSIPRWRLDMPEVPNHILEDDVGLFALNICDGSIDPYIDYDARFIIALKNFPAGTATVGTKGKVSVKGAEPRSHVLHCNGHRRADRMKLKDLSESLLGDRVDKRKRTS